ncbi:MAG: serine/threonine protein phosphatase [Bacteroidales bacterium]|nr:serine/threonine protein phosphatase [Bacteroidales bacterium]
MKNYWFIGDLHGEISLLDRLLENVLRFSPEEIVFVGDYIDRGPHAREVIDRIMELEVPVTCLMGNHEMMMLNAMEDMGYGQGYSPIELWYYNGGEATLQSFGFTSFFNFQSDMDSVYLDFFHNLKMSHVVEVGDRLKVLATHAGISPAIPLEDQVSLENYNALNRYLMEKHIDPGDSFLWIRDTFFNSPSSLWEGYLVVHGHTPTMKLKRFISYNGQNHFLFVDNDLCIRKDGENGKIVSIDIDSGSVISGRLTGLGFFIEDEDETVRLRSITVSSEEIFPRDLGPVQC